MKGIRQKGNRYQIDFSHQGKRYRRETDLQGHTIKTLEQAQTLRSRAVSEISAGTFDPERWTSGTPKDMNLRNLSEKFMATRRADLAPGTWNQYRTQFSRHINPVLGDLDVHSISTHQITALRDSLRLSDPSPVLITLKSLFTWLTSQEIISSAPKFPPGARIQRRAAIISREIQLRILHYIPRRHRPIFTWMIFQACRPTEARALKWMDIQGELVHYRRSWSASELVERTKTARDRVNWIFPEALNSLPARKQPGDFVFRTSQGKPYSHNLLTKTFRRALTLLNNELMAGGESPVEITLYEATKHSTGTHLHRQGVSLETLRQHFGHSSMNTTMIYVELDPAKDMKRECSAIGRGW